jgi:hypothetical protein
MTPVEHALNFLIATPIWAGPAIVIYVILSGRRRRAQAQHDAVMSYAARLQGKRGKR